MRRPLVLLLAVALALPGTLIAIPTGTLRVHVVDASGAPTPGAAVEARGDALPGVVTAVSDADGWAILGGLSPGRYAVRLGTSQGGGSADSAAGVASPVEVEVALASVTELTLAPPTVTATLEVRAEAEAVLPSPSPTVASNLRPEAIAPLPLGRDVRGWAQLVPGVTVTPNNTGLEPRHEPAAKAGNFYHDRGGQIGSRDNVYRLDGFDFTDFGSGGASLAFTTAAVLEAQVTTSLVSPAAPGGAGYVLDVVTRSGAARWQGGAEAFVQTPAMIERQRAADSRLLVVEEDRWDAGLSLGGPLAGDWLWGFLALQRRENDDDVPLSASASPTPRTLTHRFRRTNGFLNLGARPWKGGSLALRAYGEARTTYGGRDVNAPVNRRNRVDDEPELVTLGWHQQLASRYLLELTGSRFRQVIRTTPLVTGRGPVNTLLAQPGVVLPAWERELGSSGAAGEGINRKAQGSVGFSAFLAGLGGTHELAVGLQAYDWEESNKGSLADGVALTSLAPHLAGLTFAAARDLALLPASELDVILRALAASPTDPVFSLVDANGDGAVSEAELLAVPFTSRAANAGGINFLRQRIVRAGVNNVQQETGVAWLGDTFRRGRLTVSAGLRAEERDYIASDGSPILEMDAAYYPRLGLAIDLTGDGRHVASFGWGRYADPLRSSMLRFAGNLTGSVFADEVAIGEQWFSYRLRGQSRLSRDAGFAPSLENEVEEELQLTWSSRLGNAWALLAQAWRREDDNIIEDYDPGLYFNPAAAGDLALPPETFGYPPSGVTGVNYFLANLVGGGRRTYGVDLAVDHRRGPWSGTLQYSWRDAEGNSNSDGAADLQGDFLDLDPRQPWMWGTLPGTSEHRLKLAASWRAPWGLDVGLLASWDSGAAFTEATIFRPNTHGILYNYRRPDGSWARTGAERHPEVTTVDLRLTYHLPLTVGRLTSAVVVDVLNLLDDQGALRVEEGHNHPDFAYRQTRLVQEPRRYVAGLRVDW